MAEFDYGFTHIRIERPWPGVALFTLNRSERLNAANAALHADLAALPRRLDQDPAAQVGVVTGAGRAFCVGGDTAEIGGMVYADRVRMMWETLELVTGLVEARKPLVSECGGRGDVGDDRNCRAR